MKNIVISLKTATARREHIYKEFGKQNIHFDFFNALTPDVAKPLAEKMQLNVKDEYLTGGELACFMSHVSVWKKMVDEKISYMAVFEDDVFLGKNASAIFNTSSWIQEDWHIIKTEAFSEKVLLTQEVYSIENTERQIKHLVGKNLGTAGYILSLKGAIAYLNYIQQCPLIPLDELMFRDFIHAQHCDVYQMSPAICIQEMMLYPEKKTMLSSNLINERKTRMNKYKKKGWMKVGKEISRIINQVKYYFLGKVISFK
ncbi:glycosyltransferase family 25 protein [Acinetobacter sp. BY484]|uniref:glycosyltransferase family 25 protein n=1 Tax=Acinetobacter sp. BY484 TaxID=2820674 RepID=UPI001C241C74|nr:glycosyltransferase family 25 protein [Acinetobacter sp. BY484]